MSETLSWSQLARLAWSRGMDAQVVYKRVRKLGWELDRALSESTQVRLPNHLEPSPLRMMTACLRKLETPTKTGERWCVAWRSLSMRAPAFWYFRTYKEAHEALKQLRRRI